MDPYLLSIRSNQLAGHASWQNKLHKLFFYLNVSRTGELLTNVDMYSHGPRVEMKSNAEKEGNQQMLH
jgi:hypothetical protein